MGRYGSDEEQGSRQATEVEQSEKASSVNILSLLRLRDSRESCAECRLSSTIDRWPGHCPVVLPCFEHALADTRNDTAGAIQKSQDCIHTTTGFYRYIHVQKFPEIAD